MESQTRFLFSCGSVAVTYFLLAACFVPTQSQFYSTRQCTANASTVAQRCLGSSNANANFSCSTYCANSGTFGTVLYAYYCIGTNKTCGLTSYCYNAPLLPGETVAPTLTNLGSTLVDVPCGFGATNITGALLGITSPGNQTYVINKQVVSSTPNDPATNYVAVTQNGTIVRAKSGPAVDTTQTIAFTASQLGTGVYSNTVQITFRIRSCALQLSCPSTTTYCALQTQATFPSVTCTITNLPTGLTVGWDIPSDSAACVTKMCGATTAQLALAANGPTTLFAPFVVSSSGFSDPTVANLIYVENYNTASIPQTAAVAPNGPVGVYGPNGQQINVADGCQMLRYSATPQTGQNTPFTTGTFIGQACGNPACDGGFP